MNLTILFDLWVNIELCSILYVHHCTFIYFFAAVCALVGCVLMGPRIGRFDKKGNPVPMPGHSVPLSALGGLILIFGFFACNGTKQVRKQLFLLVSKRDLGEYARKERQLIVKEKV